MACELKSEILRLQLESNGMERAWLFGMQGITGIMNSSNYEVVEEAERSHQKEEGEEVGRNHQREEGEEGEAQNQVVGVDRHD